MNLKENARLIIFICLILISSLLFLYTEFSKSSGVVVTSVGINSACRDMITIGSTIREIAGKPVSNSRDFERAIKDLEGPITLIINNNPRSCTILENSSLDVAVRDIKIRGLRLGIDVGGGGYYSFKTESGKNIEETYNVIESRVKNYGLSNTRVEIKDGTLDILTDSEEEVYIDYLTERGNLEGKLIEEIEFSGNEGHLKFGDKEYEIILKNGKSISTNDMEYGVNQSFEIENVKFEIEEISRNRTTLSSIIFGDGDLSILKDPGVNPTRIMKQGNGYVFVISTFLSDRASENFAKITKSEEVQVDPNTGESYSKNPLIISIDDETFVELPIMGTDLGEEIEQLNIWGFRSTVQEASDDLLRLKTLIEIGKLPENLVINEKEIYDPPKGDFYISLPLYSILITSVLISVLFFIRYKKRGIIVLPLILLSISNIPLILGTITHIWLIVLFFLLGVILVVIKSEIKDWKGWLSIFLMFVMIVGIVMSKWILDVSSIIGLSILIPLVLAQGALTGDEFLSGKEVYTGKGYKRSLRWSWIISLVAILVSLLLFFIFDTLKGFGMVVTTGILISTTLAIPVYGKVVKKFSKK